MKKEKIKNMTLSEVIELVTEWQKADINRSMVLLLGEGQDDGVITAQRVAGIKDDLVIMYARTIEENAVLIDEAAKLVEERNTNKPNRKMMS